MKVVSLLLAFPVLGIACSILPAHPQPAIGAVGFPRGCQSPFALLLEDPSSLPPASKSRTLPRPNNPVATPQLSTSSSPPSPGHPPAPICSLIPWLCLGRSLTLPAPSPHRTTLPRMLCLISHFVFPHLFPVPHHPDTIYLSISLCFLSGLVVVLVVSCVYLWNLSGFSKHYWPSLIFNSM